MVFSWLGDLVICRTAITGEAGDALLAYCWQRGRRSPFGMRSFGGVMSWVQPSGRRQLIAFENISSDPVLYWVGRVPVVVSRRSSQGSMNNGSASGGDNSDYYKSLNVVSLRGLVDLDALVIEAVEQYNRVKQGVNGEAKRRRFFVRRLGGHPGEVIQRDSPMGRAEAPVSPCDDVTERISQKTLRLLKWKPEELVPATPDQSPFHGYAFPPEILAAMDEMRVWIENEKWFRLKSVPWRRGWLLHGPPGCGKSTLVRAMAMNFDLPVFALDLSTHDNETFVQAWEQVTQTAPCIALIEDVDAIFNGRENVAAKNTTRDALTFDCLLNCISGVGNSEGVFLVVTTNHPETLDPALGVVNGGQSSRPGRIDRVIELGYMREPERLTLARHILSDYPEVIAGMVAAGDGMSPAQFQDRCAQEALRLFWERKTA